MAQAAQATQGDIIDGTDAGFMADVVEAVTPGSAR